MKRQKGSYFSKRLKTNFKGPEVTLEKPEGPQMSEALISAIY